ncbi:MAG: class I SAM-dependent methyltransferase, partial [Candidatus Latescibacteria bacterium]|nr:class I SAM-dependent methyltransferase [Candidatus Latescibacterota bacterium]
GGGSYLGVDKAQEFLAAARKKHPEAWCRFIEDSLEDDDFANRIGSYGISWNCALSIFAVQEIPDIGALMENAAAILGDGALFLLVTVHPDFGDWLRDTGRMPPVTELDPAEPNSSAPWRWAGSYPIVDESREPFHLPYFHRTAPDYEAILSAHGFLTVTVQELPDPSCDLPRLVRKGISPFANFPANLYWPRIGDAPSSLAILSRKGAAREAL